MYVGPGAEDQGGGHKGTSPPTIGDLYKKTYGHKYYVAASIGFEEKSYPYLRKIKKICRGSDLGGLRGLE